APGASEDAPSVIELTLVEPAGAASVTEMFNVTLPLFVMVPLNKIGCPGFGASVHCLVTWMAGAVMTLHLAVAGAVTAPPFGAVALAVSVSCWSPPNAGGT